MSTFPIRLHVMGARRPRIRGGHRVAMAGFVAAASLVAMALLLPAACAAQDLLRGPQKIVIDVAHDRLLVSNDSTGDIVAIDSTGHQTYFVQGAGFVDGMEIAGNRVYGVTRARRVKAYDLDSASVAASVAIPGAGYLSSIVADSSGHLFISCPPKDEIYKLRLSDMAFWTFVGGHVTDAPNGMIFQAAANRLVVIEDRANPVVRAVSLADSAVTPLATLTLGGADGIAQDLNGNYYVTGYYLDGVYKYDEDFSQPPQMIFAGSGIVYPTYDASDNSLLVTCYDTSTWERIPLTASDVRTPAPRKAFLLRPSHPNPFTLGTMAAFALDTCAHTRLDVYDVSGRQIRALVDEVKSPGSYSVPWDGTDDSGRPSGRGTYYIRLSVDGVAQAQSAVLLR
jgi:hypothetical protein